MNDYASNNSSRLRRYQHKGLNSLTLDDHLITACMQHNEAKEFGKTIKLLVDYIAQQEEANIPVAPEVFFFLARIHNWIGQGPAAIDALRSAIKIEPGYQEAISLLGHLLIYEKAYEEAGYYLRLALALNPQDYVVWARLSNLYTAIGHLDATLMAQREAVRRNPENPNLKRRLSELILFGLDDPPYDDLNSHH